MHFKYGDDNDQKIKSDVYGSTRNRDFYMNDFTAEIKSELALNLPPRDEFLKLYEDNDERTSKAISQIHSYTSQLSNREEKTKDRLEEIHYQLIKKITTDKCKCEQSLSLYNYNYNI